jgi:hypothetical protein
MAWTVEYAVERKMVLVTASGEMHDEDARAQTADVVYSLKHNHATGVLVDYVEALLEVSLSRLYWLPDYAAELGAPWDARTAVVLPRIPYRIEAYQFFELVCKNIGYNVKLFETKEAAEAWLTQAAPVGEHAGQTAHA